MGEPTGEQTIRAFIAIQVEPEIVSRLTALQRALEAQLPEKVVSWTRPEHIHLTLKFLGQVPSTDIAPIADALCRACEGFSAFALDLGRIGGFPSLDSPKIIWAGLNDQSGTVLSLQRQIEAEISPLVQHSEERAFHPHLTLGRVKRARPRELRLIGRVLQDGKMDTLGSWTVAEIHLMQSILSSDGPTHTCLRTVKLES